MSEKSPIRAESSTSSPLAYPTTSAVQPTDPTTADDVPPPPYTLDTPRRHCIPDLQPHSLLSRGPPRPEIESPIHFTDLHSLSFIAAVSEINSILIDASMSHSKYDCIPVLTIENGVVNFSTDNEISGPEGVLSLSHGIATFMEEWNACQVYLLEQNQVRNNLGTRTLNTDLAARFRQMEIEGMREAKGLRRMDELMKEPRALRWRLVDQEKVDESKWYIPRKRYGVLRQFLASLR